MKKFLCLLCLLLCSCSWTGSNTKPTVTEPRQPLPLPDVQLPKKPDIPEFSGYVRIPPGGEITWLEKNANQKEQRKALKVNKFGGAYLDKNCLDNVSYALKVWDYYAKAVDSQIQTYNKGLAELRQVLNKPKEEKKKSWW